MANARRASAALKHNRPDSRYEQRDAIRLMETGEGIDFRGNPGGAAHAVADLPDPVDYPGRIVFCSNGNAGAACLAYSDGANWRVLALGANVAAA